MLSLTGLRSPPTTQELNQKLTFTLGKHPISGTNQSSPIQADRSGADTHAQQKMRGQRRKRQDSPPEANAPPFPIKTAMPLLSLVFVVLSHGHLQMKGRQRGGGIPTVSCSPPVSGQLAGR